MPKTKNRFGQVAIPPERNVLAVYPVAPLADSARPKLAAQFIELLLAPHGEQVLEKYGFLPPRP